MIACYPFTISTVAIIHVHDLDAQDCYILIIRFAFRLNASVTLPWHRVMRCHGMSITKGASIAPTSQDWANLRLARASDVAAIQNIYHEVYKGTYTYHEYTDATYLHKDITSGHSGWYVVEDATRGQEIAGCVSATVDFANARAYSRGMMMRPCWQGRGGASRLFGDAFADFMRVFAGKVRLVWAETRATSIKPQAVCETIGLNPVGILPGKDVFFNRRETPVIMAVYASSAWATRDSAITIVPELVALHDHVATMFRAMKKDDVQVSEITITENTRCKSAVIVSDFEKRFGYTMYSFTCEKTGESIDISVNHQCMNAEGMEIHCATASTARILLAFALGYLQSIGVEYVEGYCPANRSALQAAFLAAGFVPFGYVPAWNKDARTGLNVDHVIFGWSMDLIDHARLCLTAKSCKLAQVLESRPLMVN